MAKKIRKKKGRREESPIKGLIFLVARGVIRDATSNNVSVFDILEQINPDRLPAAFGRLTVFLLVGRTSGKPRKYPIRLRALQPTGKEIFAHETVADLQRAVRSRIFANLQNLLLEVPGTIEFVSEWKKGRNWEALARYPVQVTEPKHQAAGKNKMTASAGGSTARKK